MSDERNFKKIGKLQFSVEVPVDSDLALAIKLGKEKRDKTINELTDLLETGILEENKEKVDNFITVILKMNESIKLMEDAAVAVRVYKLDQENNK